MTVLSRMLVSRLWFRGRYCLSGLMLILPLIAFPFYFRQVSAPPLGANILPERQVGDFRVVLAEFRAGPPRVGPKRHLLKDYQLHIRDGYPDRIRTVYLRVGKPPNDRNLGEIMHGNPYRLGAHVRFPATLRADETLWLTLEEWDGSRHQASWPLSQVVTGVSFVNSEDNRKP